MVPCIIQNFKFAILTQRLKSLTFYFNFWAILLTCAFSLLYCFSAYFIFFFLIKSQASLSFPFKDGLVPLEMVCWYPLVCCCSVWCHNYSMQMENPAVLLFLLISGSVCRRSVSQECWQFLLKQRVRRASPAAVCVSWPAWEGRGIEALLSLPWRVCRNTVLSHAVQEILYSKPESSAKDSINNMSISKQANN